MIKQFLASVAAGLFITGQASAATSSIQKDADNTIAGVCACSIFADGEGVDWTGGVLRIDLTSGSVYNGAPDSNGPQSAFWGVPGFEKLEWDTWFGVPGDGTNGIAGGAGDLGGGPLSVSGQTISVTWFNTTTTDTGPLRVGNVSLSNDASGTWQMILSFASGVLVQSGGTVEGGAPCIPEPGTLALLGIGAAGLSRRSQTRA